MLLDNNIQKLAEGLKSGSVKCVDLVEEAYDNIEKYDGTLGSFITLVDKKVNLDIAAKIDKNQKRGESALFGIPYVLKDAYVTKGIRTTAGSNVLGDFIPPYSATVFDRLEGKGAILIGKMSMDAWGHGASGENTDFKIPKNPWDLKRVAGGSGGGPAIALAMRFSTFAIGEDTGGSIRNPASWNNVSALKVTYGRVSRWGAISYASSFDTVGPSAKSVSDCAFVLEEIAGWDPYDATTSTNKVEKYSKLINKSVKGKKIAIPREFFSNALYKEARELILKTAQVWKKLGVKITEISLPLLEYGVPMYYTLVTSETSSNLARYDSIRFGQARGNFTKETKRRIMTGTHCLSAGYSDEFYKNASRSRTHLIDIYKKSLEGFDAILAPVNPSPPPKLGETIEDPVKNMVSDLYTGLTNLIGIPSLSLPCGFDKNNLPVGMQLIGKMFSEEILLNLGNLYQKETDWHLKRPKLIS